MSSRPTLAQVKASNAATAWSYRPTAVFVGGTSGIGEFTAKALAKATNGNVHIFIVGRSRAKADKIIESFPKSLKSQYDFVQCDVTIMKNIVSACAEIASKTTSGKLNYLVLSQGVWPFSPSPPVLNGIEAKTVLNFYSRWKFIDELIPMLEKAANAGEDARAMSVLNPMPKIPVDLNDLGMRHTSLSNFDRAKMTTPYTNVLVQEYSKLHPRVSFCHIFPGIVDTPNSDAASWWTKPIVFIGKFFMITSEESGERMLAALLKPEYKAGGFFLNEYAEEVDAQRDSNEVRKAVLEHYKAEVSV